MLIAIAVSIIGIGGSAMAQRDITDNCKGNPGVDWDIQIGACTAAIQSGRWRGKNLDWAFINRGMVYSAKGEYDRAITDYNQAIKLNPSSSKAYNNRANAYYRKGEYARAIPDYDRALKIDPNFTTARNNRAEAVKMLNQ
ncbi:MAG: tetratricopeptide repeat protein [Rhizobiales bacterium]|nr:tetratricopeptide repeat protein [Hyphomicrobiales bacterium]